MIFLQFSEQDLVDIDEACDDPELPRMIKRKLMCLKMHHQKMTNLAITRILNISANTVTSYIKEFRDQGIAGGEFEAERVGRAGRAGRALFDAEGFAAFCNGRLRRPRRWSPGSCRADEPDAFGRLADHDDVFVR